MSDHHALQSEFVNRNTMLPHWTVSKKALLRKRLQILTFGDTNDSEKIASEDVRMLLLPLGQVERRLQRMEQTNLGERRQAFFWIDV